MMKDPARSRGCEDLKVKEMIDSKDQGGRSWELHCNHCAGFVASHVYLSTLDLMHPPFFLEYP